ncbi:copper-binding protein [Ramlibacter albus]|uniref:Copper-binding protein n=1 Tax=Ramlibacter albus TaxID=2079448 RepID=A0A923S309_9BURK|nr:copper-binding protein [Ramlibacter albus]MBC5765950.1 copper-binding protein [Ramlibacter albus]
MARKFLFPAITAVAAAALAFTSFAADLTSGEVRKVDKTNKKITLKHEHIKNLDMPPMTMVFGVKDAKLLDKVKNGDKVRFAAVDEGGGKLVVTAIEAAK